MTAKAEALDDYDRVVGRTEPPTALSFDVTQVIGTVTLDGSGHHTPTESAFLLIAAYGDDGVFRFPDVDGRDIIVTVQHDAV